MLIRRQAIKYLAEVEKYGMPYLSEGLYADLRRCPIIRIKTRSVI